MSYDPEYTYVDLGISGDLSIIPDKDLIHFVSYIIMHGHNLDNYNQLCVCLEFIIIIVVVVFLVSCDYMDPFLSLLSLHLEEVLHHQPLMVSACIGT